jgi:archaellum component FlaG (FlaF/FlaG flagellin family)
MNRRRTVSLIVLFYTTLLFSHPAHAQLSQQGPKLVGTAKSQGMSVALSADGNTAIVGGGDPEVWMRSGGVWTKQSTKLVGSGAVGDAGTGTSVALSADGNTAIVGGSFDNDGTGAAWIWTRNDGVWTQQSGKLVASDAVGNGRQGASVSLSADGNTAIVGGPGDTTSIGAAWVWTRSGGVWTQQSTKLVGSGGVGNSLQGTSVALSADGNTALVGGPGGGTYGNELGAAWVWTRSGGVWTRQSTKLVGSGAEGNSLQGTSVALDGNVAIVGAPYRLGPGPDPDLTSGLVTGAAWIWTRSGAVWAQQSTRLVGSDGVDASQGSSVALSGDGKTAIIGGPSDNNQVGAAWIFAAEAVPPRRRGVRP